MEHFQAGEPEMHPCFTPPSSTGQPSPTRQDEDSKLSCQLWPDGIQTRGRVTGSEHNSSYRDRRHYYRPDHIPMRFRVSSQHFRSRRSSSPSSDSDVTNNSSEDELFVLPDLPPSKNLSYYVQRAKRQFKPYDTHRGHGPNAIELQFLHKSVGKYSGETDMTLADVQANCSSVACEACLARPSLKPLLRCKLPRTKLLETMLEQDALEYARSDAEASSFNKLLVGRTSKELNINIDFNIGAYGCDMTSFMVSDVQLDHLEAFAHKLGLPEEDLGSWKFTSATNSYMFEMYASSGSLTLSDIVSLLPESLALPSKNAAGRVKVKSKAFSWKRMLPSYLFPPSNTIPWPYYRDHPSLKSVFVFSAKFQVKIWHITACLLLRTLDDLSVTP
ncbi:uncharacterized protein F5891DRAFT_977192 [Suillus fuscotomentosus]|uniref:Uncharacterized protein n=1 Tax=Suillus fuscotomentosus TaxID=1912939 RepID=A0AAD4EDL8_9AGAM|nr:uncharacterized protein F5891DRAFT_977192 [Suillus fuscotomentosus]KAG1904330.1 hypothetical protein F5891DRAFT_977192 [Suillus fuscotomentosus]